MAFAAAAQTVSAADAPEAERVAFIRKTYAHLGAAVLLFVALEYMLMHSSLAMPILKLTVGHGRIGWLAVLGAFMLVSWIAENWARSQSSPGMQYAGLALYVVAETVIFLPLLYIAAKLSKDENIIGQAGLITGVVFAGLTATVFFTKSDFSWMRQILAVAGFAALGLIVASLLFGFTLGTLFAGVMVVVASGYILYHTSNVLHHYPIGSHVAAALALFAAVALLFWYVLRILMDRRR
jgi:FtsH-binding integral membrane protein